MTSSTIVTLDQFVNHLFPSRSVPQGVFPLFWVSGGKSPGYPVDYPSFRKSLEAAESTERPVNCYYGTASARPGPKEGALRNRQALMYAYHVLVLDDIGTGEGAKIHPYKIPRAVAELVTYRLETSPGNEQWGFAFGDPITNMAAANCLLRLMVEGCGSDSGGLMVNKAVRLPAGQNCKKNKDESWRYNVAGAPFGPRVLEFNDTYVQPQELLDAVECSEHWDEVQAGVVDTRRAKTTTAFRTVQAQYHANFQGVTDDVLIWLNEERLVVDEGHDGSWITIKCPQHDQHTTGDGTASYSPLGWGEYPEMRGFHCFHAHCSGFKALNFLQWVVAEGGPESAIHDLTGGDLAGIAHMADGSEIVVLDGSARNLRIAGWRDSKQNRISYVDRSGKLKSKTAAQYILEHPQLMKLYGTISVPGEGRVLERGGRLYLNDWMAPPWARTRREVGEDNPNVVRFLDFLDYLFPNEDDADFMLDHLASKAQNPLYRGPGIIMTTPTQGTGRGTLTRMIRSLWGDSNCVDLTTGDLVRGISGESFNGWIAATWILVPEAHDATMSGREWGTAYEALKRYQEPSGVMMMRRIKYGSEGTVECHGSIMMASNHEGDGSLKLDATDRRFTRLENTTLPRSPEYFRELNAWMKGDWQADVWHFLMGWDLSNYDGYAPQVKLTDDIYGFESMHPVEQAVALCLDYSEKYANGFLPVNAYCDILRRSHGALLGLDIEKLDIVKRKLNGISTVFKSASEPEGKTIRSGAKNIKPRRMVRPGAGAELGALDLHDRGALQDAYRSAVGYPDFESRVKAHWDSVLDDYRH